MPAACASISGTGTTRICPTGRAAFVAKSPDRAGPVFIAAHSFGALAAVQAASDHADRIAGVLLVAPADPEHFGVAEFLPARPLEFPAIVVASTNDPWISLDSAAHWADRWGADLISLGEAGHINAESGFGPWPKALALLERLRRASEFRVANERLAALSLSHARVALNETFGRPGTLLPDAGAIAARLRRRCKIATTP